MECCSNKCLIIQVTEKTCRLKMLRADKSKIFELILYCLRNENSVDKRK